MEMRMDRGEPKWTKVAGDRAGGGSRNEGPQRQSESIAKDILTNPKKALYFTSMVRVLLEDRAYAVGRTGRAELQFNAPVSHYALESVLAKLEILAHDPAGSAGEISFDDNEWQALVPVFARFQEASAAVAQMDTFFPDAELMAVMDWAALQKPNWELSGLLAMPGGRADGFFPEVMKTLAFIDPARFETMKNSFSVARRLAKSDHDILTRMRKLGEDHGIPEKNLIAILDGDDWKENLKGVLFERIRGKETMIARGVAHTRVNAITAGFLPGIESYRRNTEPRQKALAEITEGMVDLLGAPGLLRATLEQVAFRPKGAASPEAKAAYENLQAVQGDVNAFVGDIKASDEWIQEQLAKDYPALWANRHTDPGACDELARHGLDDLYHSHLGGPVGSGEPRLAEGSVWERVWQLLASFFGTAYGSREVGNLSSRIRGFK